MDKNETLCEHIPMVWICKENGKTWVTETAFSLHMRRHKCNRYKEFMKQWRRGINLKGRCR
jgi:hypothetical protein